MACRRDSFPFRKHCFTDETAENFGLTRLGAGWRDLRNTLFFMAGFWRGLLFQQNHTAVGAFFALGQAGLGAGRRNCRDALLFVAGFGNDQLAGVGDGGVAVV